MLQGVPLSMVCLIESNRCGCCCCCSNTSENLLAEWVTDHRAKQKLSHIWVPWAESIQLKLKWAESIQLKLKWAESIQLMGLNDSAQIFELNRWRHRFSSFRFSAKWSRLKMNRARWGMWIFLIFIFFQIQDVPEDEVFSINNFFKFRGRRR